MIITKKSETEATLVTLRWGMKLQEQHTAAKHRVGRYLGVKELTSKVHASHALNLTGSVAMTGDELSCWKTTKLISKAWCTPQMHGLFLSFEITDTFNRTAT